MEFSSIDHLDVYVYREKKYKNGNTKMKWCLLSKELDNDLRPGEVGRVKGSEKNKIKKLENGKYQFIRFDEIQTHIVDFKCNYNIDIIKYEINNKLDYNLKYADDRVKLVKTLLEDNDWIYDLISTHKIIRKEQKKKKDFLAEDQALDRAIDYISDYINHVKFKNEKDEQIYNELRKEQALKEKKDKRKKTSNDFEELNRVINTIQSYHHKSTKKKLEDRGDTEVVGNLEERETQGDFIYQEEISQRVKSSKFTYHMEEIPHSYWDKMFYGRENRIPFYDDLYIKKSEPHNSFRPKVLETIKKDVDRLYNYLGLDIKDTNERREFTDKLKKEIGERDYRILRRTYTDLKGDYELSKKLLVNEVNLNTSKHSTVYSIDSDTWYENENGEIIELSRNMVSMGNKNTYVGLILNYKDLKDKYRDKQNSDWWALIKDFEKLIEQTKFTEEEKFVLDVIFDGYSQKQLRDLYKSFNLNSLSKNKISRLINEQIPSKLLDTYLSKIDDWLYTEKIQGKYKKCSKCEEIKLISNERYFGKDARNKDGFKSICKKCDNYTKKRE